MLHDTREMYDIETLWTVGAEYDDELTEEQDLDARDYIKAQRDNLLTVSEKVEYAFEERDDGFMKEKFSKNHEQDMESATDWHKIKK